MEKKSRRDFRGGALLRVNKIINCSMQLYVCTQEKYLGWVVTGLMPDVPTGSLCLQEVREPGWSFLSTGFPPVTSQPSDGPEGQRC